MDGIVSPDRSNATIDASTEHDLGISCLERGARRPRDRRLGRMVQPGALVPAMAGSSIPAAACRARFPPPAVGDRLRPNPLDHGSCKLLRPEFAAEIARLAPVGER